MSNQSFNSNRKLHHIARIMAMQLTDQISDKTSREKVTAFIREYMDIPHGDDDAVVEFFVNRQRNSYAAPEKFVSTRLYKHDRAMLAAASRLKGMPVLISMNRAAQLKENKNGI